MKKELSIFQLATLEALNMLGYKYLVKDKDYEDEIGWTMACKKKPIYSKGSWKTEPLSEKMNEILILENDFLFKDLDYSNVHSIQKLLIQK